MKKINVFKEMISFHYFFGLGLFTELPRTPFYVSRSLDGKENYLYTDRNQFYESLAYQINQGYKIIITIPLNVKDSFPAESSNVYMVENFKKFFFEQGILNFKTPIANQMKDMFDNALYHPLMPQDQLDLFNQLQADNSIPEEMNPFNYQIHLQ